MKSPIFILALLSQIFFSCETKEDKLEIYLTNNLIESYEGVALRNAIKDTTIVNTIENLHGLGIRVDTVAPVMIYSGRFNATKKDLQSKPFITDPEIIGLDFKKSEILFSNSVSKKISNALPQWKNSNVRGRQFVLCRNNRVILQGYLFSQVSSYWSNTYQIHFKNDQNPKQKTVRFNFNDSINFNDNHLMKNKELFSAFENRNRKLNGL